MQASCSSETSVTIHQTTWRNDPVKLFIGTEVRNLQPASTNVQGLTLRQPVFNLPQRLRPLAVDHSANHNCVPIAQTPPCSCFRVGEGRSVSWRRAGVYRRAKFLFKSRLNFEGSVIHCTVGWPGVNNKATNFFCLPKQGARLPLALLIVNLSSCARGKKLLYNWKLFSHPFHVKWIPRHHGMALPETASRYGG